VKVRKDDYQTRSRNWARRRERCRCNIRGTVNTLNLGRLTDRQRLSRISPAPASLAASPLALN
jgi:hypothetical protein